MVAPAVIAGLASLGGIVLGAVLGKQKRVLAVVCLHGSDVVGKTFSDMDEASSYQSKIARKGVATMLLEKVDGSYRCLKAMSPGAHPVAVRRLQISSAGGYRNFDTLTEQQDMVNLTTRNPTPAWAKQANDGPYPADYIKPDRVLPPILPLFDDTTSSHMWKTNVETWKVPDRFFPGHRGPATQPAEIVVKQRLQFPLDDPNKGP